MTAQATIHELRNGIVPAAQNLPNVSVGMLDSASYKLAKAIAVDLAASNLIPQRYQGNAPNCLIALNMSARIGADPLMVMQNLYVVHGTPAWSAQFMIATFNACGRFTSIRYEFKGEEGSDVWSCRAWATEKATGGRIEGAWISIAIAKAEGWYGKNGSKWQTMPQQMLQYRAASWMIRAYAPEIAMGIQSVDEVHDTYDATETAPGVYTVTAGDLRQAGAAIEGTTAPTTIDMPAQAEPEKASKPKAQPKEQAQAAQEPASILCPNDPDEDGNPQSVYVTMCDTCQLRPLCPSWGK